MAPDLVWAISATAMAVAMAVLAFWKHRQVVAERNRFPRIATPLPNLRGTWTAPSPDPGRYQVIYHFNGETRELFHGYDPLKARQALGSGIVARS